MASVIAYVDGFNLYHGIHQQFHRRYLWLDLETLVRRLRPHDKLVSVKYFTAHVLDDPEALARQRTYLHASRSTATAMVDVVHGRYQRKDRTCRQCGSAWPGYEEKETDVNIAVSLVADTANKASDIALIISADSDLCPAIRTARTLDGQRGMIAAFPPKRSSFEIRTLIPRAFTIATADLRNSMLPNEVVDAVSGSVDRRPDKWY